MLLVDTNVLLAAADTSTPEHQRRAALLDERTDLAITTPVAAVAELGLGLVDASIVAIAERLNLTTIATLNRRDFAVVRPAHCDAFELIS